MKVCTKAVKIDHIHTDFVVMNFKNNMLIIITQYQKPGCFIDAKKQGEGDNAVYSLTPLLGEDDVYFPVARYIYEKLSLPKSTVFSIALKCEVNKTVLEAFCNVLREINAW